MKEKSTKKTKSAKKHFKMKGWLKGVLITLAVVIFLLALPFIVLSTATTHTVSKALLGLVSESTRAEVEVGDIDYQVIPSYPYLNVQLYPVVVYSNVFSQAALAGDTLSQADSSGIEKQALASALVHRDTLAVIDSVAISFHWTRFLSSGELEVGQALLKNPRIYAETRTGLNNWDIVYPSVEEPDTTASAPLPPIYWRNVSIENGNVYYQHDSLSMQAGVNQLALKSEGSLLPQALQAQLKLQIDSIHYADAASAAYSLDTLTFDLQAGLAEKGIDLRADLRSKGISMEDSLLAIERKPFGLLCRANCDTAFQKFQIDTLVVSFDKTGLLVNGRAEILPTPASYYMDLKALLVSPQLGTLLTIVPKPFQPYFKGIRLDGGASLSASAKGIYGPKRMPVIQAKVGLNKVQGSSSRSQQKIDLLDLQAEACYHPTYKDSTFLAVQNFHFKSAESSIQLSGKFSHKKARALLDLQAKSHLNLKKLNSLYPFYENSKVQGLLDANINTNFYLDDLKNKKWYDIRTHSTITGDNIYMNLPSLETQLFVDSLRMRLNTNTGVQLRRAGKIDTSLVNSRIAFRNTYIRHKKSVKFDVKRFVVSFLVDNVMKNEPPRLKARVVMRGVDARANDTIAFRAKRALVNARMLPNKQHPTIVSTGKITFRFDSLLFATPKSGMFLDSSIVTMDATPRFRKYYRRKSVFQPRVAIPDSLQKVITIDSLFTIINQITTAKEPMEKYMKKFENHGHMYINAFYMYNPAFPLPARLQKVDFTFNDDTLQLKDLNLHVGRSNLSLNGQLSNVRKYLLRNKKLTGNLDLTSQQIDINQLLNASYQASLQAQAATQSEQANQNIDQLQEVAQAEEPDSTEPFVADSLSQAALVPIPKNLDLRFNANIDTVYFAKMKLADFQGKVRAKKGILSIANLYTNTQVGSMSVNVSYDCPTKKKADVAFALAMDSIQVGEIVEVLPQVDSMMPMLRSFDGSVAFEVSANVSMDSMMRLDLPTLNAAAMLRGDSLVLMDGETFSEIAKMLLFSKKTKNLIDSISVELLVRNNQIEIFPFMVSMDKYRVGVGGKQNLDTSFKYHIAVLKSPLPFRLGLDVYGTFDKIKFRLASAKFKDSKTRIAKGGYLLRDEDADLRKQFHDKVVKEILQQNK